MITSQPCKFGFTVSSGRPDRDLAAADAREAREDCRDGILLHHVSRARYETGGTPTSPSTGRHIHPDLKHRLAPLPADSISLLTSLLSTVRARVLVTTALSTGV